MFGSLFNSENRTVPLPPATWDQVYLVFIQVLMRLRKSGRVVEPNEFAIGLGSTLSELFKLSISEPQVEDILAGYLDYCLEPSIYNPTLDLMNIDCINKNNEQYTKHCIDISKHFAKTMFGAQSFLAVQEKYQHR